MRAPAPLDAPAGVAFAELRAGSGEQAVSTTMGVHPVLRNLGPRREDRQAGRADHPRRSPHVRDGLAVPGAQDLRRQGQKYEPVDHDLLLSYTEATDGQILEEGITEAGSMASFIAAGTSYATRGVPMVPFYTFYSMFGFQRVGDLIWQAADARARGFLLGATGVARQYFPKVFRKPWPPLCRGVCLVCRALSMRVL